MSFRRTGKLLTLVGFVICLSLLGILYGNLSTITEERDHILVKKNEIKQEVEELNTRISSLQEKISRLESSLNRCNAAKLEAEEGKSLLQQEADSFKNDIEHRKIAEENIKSSSDQEIQQLKAQLLEAQLESSRHRESAAGCNIGNEELQSLLTVSKNRLIRLEGNMADCIVEKRRLIQEAQDSNKEVVVKKDDSSEVDGGIVNPVAAVPAPAVEANLKEAAVDLVDHVADIPEAPKDNAVVDTNQAIPGAQAPAPVAQVEQPVVPGDIGGAVAPAPGQDFKRDIEEQLIEGMGGFQPLQPIPEGALAESLDKVRQEEQLQQLQERQDQLQPQLPQFPEQDNQEPGNNELPNLNLQPAQPPEIQPAQPAPNGNENGDAVAMEPNNVDPASVVNNNEESNNIQDNVVDNEVQLGLLPDFLPAQPAPNV